MLDFLSDRDIDNTLRKDIQQEIVLWFILFDQPAPPPALSQRLLLTDPVQSGLFYKQICD